MLSYLPEILIWAPLPLTIIFYQIHVRIKKKPWKATHFTVRWTTPLYIIAVGLLILHIFQLNLFAYIIIGLLLILSIILIVQRRKRVEVELIRGVNILMKLSFLLFVPIYLGLVIYWLVLAILPYI